MTYTIPGLPDEIAEVPQDAEQWLQWREVLLAYRYYMRELAETDGEVRQIMTELSRRSVSYFIAMFGVIHEPRTQKDVRIAIDPTKGPQIVFFDRPPGWYPWVPYPFQIETWNFIDDTLGKRFDPLGKGDGLVEKARDMGGTWSFCAHAAHGWLFKDNFIVGMISLKAQAVDGGTPRSMFYKVESLIGLNEKVTPRTEAPNTIYHKHHARIPRWLMPNNLDPQKHDLKMNIMHPTKSNQIVGESTQSKAGIGDRCTYIIIDEAAKIENLETIWDGYAAVTDNRFALSSPDRQFGDGMFNLVEQARRATYNPHLEGASLLSLPYTKHPLREINEEWMAFTKARFASDPEIFEREYLLKWTVGETSLVYPAARECLMGDFPYQKNLGQVYVSIDPGLRDATAIGWFQYDPRTNAYRMIDALVLDVPNSQYLTPILMGFPQDHEEREAYYHVPEAEDILRIMDLTHQIRQDGTTQIFVGDTYGENAGGDGRTTFYEGITLRSRELSGTYPNLNPMDIRVQVKYDEGARFHMRRKEVTSALLPRLVFNETPRTNYVLNALKSYHYKIQNGRANSNEPRKPEHSWESHPSTMVEFFAIRVTLGERLRTMAQKEHKPRRHKLTSFARG